MRKDSCSDWRYMKVAGRCPTTNRLCQHFKRQKCLLWIEQNKKERKQNETRQV